MRIIISKSLVLVALAALLMSASFALALPNNVSNSKHNFSSDNPGHQGQYIGEFKEVCKYCHTPHNAAPSNKLLWNKANRTDATYRMYTSSRTLTRATVTGTFTSDSPSLLCLGCHDGKTAMNVMHNTTGGVDASAGYGAGAMFVKASGSDAAKTINSVLLYDMFDFLQTTPIGAANMNLGAEAGNALQGDNLQNDHPVGFSYEAVISERSAGLYTIPQVSANSVNRIKFFGATKRLECSSCHNPHADAADTAVKPFLVMTNSGSALCLSCHNK